MCWYEGGARVCGASVANDITAALANEGYFVLADICEQIALFGLGKFAVMLYVLAVFAGLMMMAMGQPPKLYLWFLLGPVIYDWLLFTDSTSPGVRWVLANQGQDQELVWQKAEVGIRNTNYFKRHGFSWHVEQGPQGGQLNGKVQLPWFFLWLDEQLSDMITQLSLLTGIYLQEPMGGTASASGSVKGYDSSWAILTNSKWPLLENITAVRFHNEDVREAWVWFMSSECGDLVADKLDTAAYISAAHAHGKDIPSSVFLGGAATTFNYNEIHSEMEKISVPMPYAIRALLDDTQKTSASQGSLVDFSGKGLETQWLNSTVYDLAEQISCDDYFYLIMQAARWEAGHAFHQWRRVAADYGIEPKDVVYNFLYGWDVYKNDTNAAAETRTELSTEEQSYYITDLIMLHLLRNEFAFMPTLPNIRFARSEQSVNWTLSYQKSVGSKNKFGELYTWAKLMPYIQGMLLYILAVAYPFCCMMIVIPGFHKAFLSWVGFFAWAKSWDFGFAMVMAVERSVWSTIGRGADKRRISEIITGLQDFGSVHVSCGEGESCPVPMVRHARGSNVFRGDPGFGQDWGEAFRQFDVSLLLAPNLDLDLANSYYIYIMSALYFAVPVVTGQVLLGAKAGAGNIASNMFQGVASDNAGAVKTGLTGEVNRAASDMLSAVDQASYAKEMRKNGLGAAALLAGNQSLDNSAMSAKWGTLSDVMAGKARATQMGAESFNSAQQPSLTLLGPWAGGAGAGVGRFFHNLWASRAGADLASQVAGSTAPPPSGIGADDVPPISRAESFGGQAGLALATAAYQATAHQQKQKGWEAQVEAQALGNDYRISGFGAQANSQAQNTMSSRYQDLAQQRASEGAWRSRRNMAARMTEGAASLGVFSGAFSANSKPISYSGMAGMGMFDFGTNSDASNAFFYPQNQFGDWVAREQTGMQRDYESEQVRNAYSGGWTVLGAGAHTAKEAFTNGPELLYGVSDEFNRFKTIPEPK